MRHPSTRPETTPTASSTTLTFLERDYVLRPRVRQALAFPVLVLLVAADWSFKL